MSLYDRKPLNYKGYQNETNNEAFAQSDIALISFVKQTYQLFAGSLLAATVGAYIGISALGYLVISAPPGIPKILLRIGVSVKPVIKVKAKSSNKLRPAFALANIKPNNKANSKITNPI